MAAYSLFPSYGVLAYRSAYGAHKMTLPTTAWNSGLGSGGFGGYLGHDAVTVNDAETIWLAWAAILAPFFLPTTTLQEVTIYSKASPTAPSIPQTIIPLNVVGTSASAESGKATMQQFNGKSVIFQPAKIVLLDSPLGASFDKILHAAFGVNDLAVEGFLTDTTHPFSARDGSVYRNFANKTLKLNDKLRRAYGMS